MRKRKVSLPFLLGIGLILCSLCLLLVHQIRLSAGARTCREAVSQIQSLLPERTQGVPGTYPNTNMPVLEIGGTDYCGILEVPAFGITLPVANHWDGKKLLSAPRRYYGSVYDGSLVIGGADDARQFAFCRQIQIGAVITVTDMTGAQFSYTVSSVDRTRYADTAWLTQSGCQLVLFCRDPASFGYLAVRCISTTQAQ